MPYICGLGYMKRNGHVTRTTMVRGGAKQSRFRPGGLVLRGPGATVYLSARKRSRFVPTRDLLRRITRF